MIKSNCKSNFIYTFTSISLTSLTFVGLFNIIVDPYGIINSPVISNFNESKPAKVANVRLFKTIKVTDIKPKTIFLGTSRTEYGLDPNHSSLNKKQRVYNLGLPNASMYEQMRYLQHALANQEDLELVVIGLDFSSFNKDKSSTGFAENRLEKSRPLIKDLLNTSLSFDALRASVQTVSLNVRTDKPNPYHQDGMRNLTYYAHNQPPLDVFKKYLSIYLNEPELYGRYSLSQEMLASLKAIVEICKQRDIGLKVFISPSHATQWEAIQVAGLWSTFEQWKREIVEITPVWDFSGYNSITTEPIDTSITNFYDSAHYSKEVGDLILNRIMKYQEETVPNDFGVLITADNIEDHLEQTLADRKTYKENNATLVEFVQTLKN